MDNNKNVIGALAILAVLILLPNASALDWFVENDYSQWDLNFEDAPFAGVGINLSDGVTEHIEVRAFNIGLYEDAFIFKVSVPDGAGDPTAYLEIDCAGYNENYSIGELSNWQSEGFAWIQPPLYLGNVNQTTQSTSNESGFIDVSQSCDITLYNDDGFGVSYFEGWGASCAIGQFETDRFGIPNQAMADMVNGVANIVTSALGLIEILLTLGAVVLLIAFLVFIWKLIEWIGSRVAKLKGSGI